MWYLKGAIDLQKEKPRIVEFVCEILGVAHFFGVDYYSLPYIAPIVLKFDLYIVPIMSRRRKNFSTSGEYLSRKTARNFR